MTLSTGTRLGPYEITALLGAGGMGEVYRARDSKLNRDVAIKVLPDLFANDSERLARFQREAQVLASLNHPNIAHIYGVEDSSNVHAIVMELVEGPTLADRIAQGPIALNEALPIAKQIADALEAAHEQGVIHRDLKPTNIKVREDGTVRVLDFGLAKLVDPGGAVQRSPQALATALPTITTPAMMTGLGMILGTAAYMSPEQAKGKTADKRSDIWAFGCVLYEMLTGKRAFAGHEISETLASVLAREPNWSVLPTSTPPPIRTLLERSLEKNRAKRTADMAVAAFLLTESSSWTAVPIRWSTHVRWRVGVVVLAVTAGAGGAAMGAWLVWRAPAPFARVSRTTITPSAAEALRISGTERDLALTPDGTQLVYVGTTRSTIVVRSLSQLTAQTVRGLGTIHHPFVSPDGQWLTNASWPRSLTKCGPNGFSTLRLMAPIRRNKMRVG